MPVAVRATNLLDALQKNLDYWSPLPEGAKVFTIVGDDGKEADVLPLLWKEKGVKQCRGALVVDFQMSHTELLTLDPSIIETMLWKKQYRVVDTKPRFLPS